MPKATLMLVEDEEQQREALTMLFEAEGYRVLAAESAEKAIELLQGDRPDMIISDVKLPGADGFTLYDMVRGNNNFRSIPFLFTTGYNDPASIERVTKLGALGYITKPYNLESLMQKIRENTGDR